MKKDIATEVLNNPKFIEMAKRKSTMGWGLAITMFVIYVLYILVIGMSPQIFGKPLAPGMITTWGIPIGAFVIVFAFFITGLYVRKSNGEFEIITQEVVKDAEKSMNGN